MTAATVTSKGQVTIPADIRASFAIEAGDQLLFYTALEGDLRVHVRKPKAGSGAGILKAGGPRVTVETMNDDIARSASDRVLKGGKGR